MLKGIDINETLEYVSQSDPDKDNPTKFVIRNVTNSQKMKLFAGIFDESGNVKMEKLQENAIPIVKAGLAEIRNFDGKDIKEISDKVIDSLSIDLLTELMQKIVEYNFIKPEQEKN